MSGTIADRLRGAEVEAIEMGDFAAAEMLGEIAEDWAAGRVSPGNAGIALSGWATRRERLAHAMPNPEPTEQESV